jgi:uridine kinase
MLPSRTIKNPKFANALVLLMGASCCGKTTLSIKLKKLLGSSIVFLSMDRYYKNNGGLVVGEGSVQKPDFDCPDAISMDDTVQDVTELLNGNSIDAPIYDFTTHSRDSRTDRINPAPIILLEGILAFNDPRLCEMASLKIVITCDDAILVDRRHVRDSNERGRTPEDISRQLWETVMPGKKKYIDPMIPFADIVLINNEHNKFQGENIVSPAIQDLIDQVCGKPLSENNPPKKKSVTKLAKYIKALPDEEKAELLSLLSK